MITVNSSPSGKPSLQDDLWHIVSSDNSDEQDFKYVFQVFNSTEELATIKQFPEPETGKGYFNPSQIINSEISYAWFEPEDKIYLRNPNLTNELGITYSVRYGEDFSGVTTLNMASGETTVYNWRPPLFGRRSFDLTTKDNKFVTSRPMYANCNFGEGLFIGCHSDTDIALIINKYNASGILIAGNNDNVDTPTDKYGQLNISPDGINGELGSGFIDSSVAYYTVQVDGTDNIFRVNMYCDRDFKVIPLHFINMWGMFDTARFGLINKLTSETERKSYKKKGYEFGTSVEYYTDKNVYNETKVNYSQKTESFYKLAMDAPTDDEYMWLHELIESPLIYAEIDGFFYPVTIKDTNYEFSQYRYNRLKPLEIEIELNQTRYSHAR